MNTLLNQVFERISDHSDFSNLESTSIPVLVVVEVLKEQKLITSEDYQLFIADERSYGSVQGIISDYQFSYIGMTFTELELENPTGIPETEMYKTIFKLINKELFDMKHLK